MSENNVKHSSYTDLSLDWETLFDSRAETEGSDFVSISDGLIMSLSNCGRVDMEYISKVTGEDFQTIIDALRGSVYQNPRKWEECIHKGWETADEYLSGNLARKRREALEAESRYQGVFTENLKAIEKVIPESASSKDIYITLGSPWVPTDVIDDFVRHLFCLQSSTAVGTVHDEYTGKWYIPNKSRYRRYVRSHTYGTLKMPAVDILEKTLNMKTLKITDEIYCPENASRKKRVVNKDETVLVLEKQANMIQKFQSWVWKDEKRRERLQEIFEDKYGCVRRRVFDGSFLKFPTMSTKINLYPYQKDAVARILFTPNTLLAHDVGSGKTFVMIAAGMELRRMGISEKNLYVVPNHIIGQWKSIFQTMYPQAKLLIVEAKCFSPDKRSEVLRRIRDEDYDAILMTYSCFERIPLSKLYYIDELRKEREAVRNSIIRTRGHSSGLKRKYKQIQEELERLSLEPTDNESIFFDELGITRLFVDEAHNFKNVPIDTKIERVLGISPQGSKKCKEMMEKVHMVQSQNMGGGVVMATATPVTNSVTDAFIMQKYLQSGELAMLDIQSFDGWIGMFAEKVSEFEIDVDTGNYRLATRFAKFHNLPELTALLSSVADFHQVDKSAGIPDFDGYDDTLIEKTDAFAAYLKEISQRADAVRNGFVPRHEDNMLKITTDGRKAALDLRLVDRLAVYTPVSKAARCAVNVSKIYYKTAAERSAQLIFCDSSTPKADFNLYDEIKRLLKEYGIPGEHIAYVHDANTETKRSRLFAAVQNGEIRILIGSTFKLGLGVNVQERLIALHHLDVPWRPADMVQREGRILRQGNLNPRIQIFRYITEGSFDAYSWQLLETKQRFICALLSGSLKERSGRDVDDTVLNYAEVKALAVGNPLIKKRVETANLLSRYLILQRRMVEMKLHLHNKLEELPQKKTAAADLLDKCRSDRSYYSEYRREYSTEERHVLGGLIINTLNGNILRSNERFIAEYQGFGIMAPSGMSEAKPFVWVIGQGRYYVAVGDSEAGALIRIDNFLNGLEEREKRIADELENLRMQEISIESELRSMENYADLIEKYENELKSLDKKLGVENK